jgi:hypothetical protein
MASSAPAEPRHDPLAVATSVPRLVAELLVALPYIVRELPHLVQDVRELVRQLTRLAEGAPSGALGDLVGGLARAAEQDGELSALLRETAKLANSRSDDAAHRNGAAAARVQSASSTRAARRRAI